MKLSDYNNQFGDIDLFLLDLLLKGEVSDQAEVLDAGCGAGRNTFFFLRHSFRVTAIDKNPADVGATNLMSRSFNKGDVAKVGNLLSLPFHENSFDLIVCSRTLHFAESLSQFNQMASELKRVLRTSGLLYLSMNSSIGLDRKVVDESNHYLMTDEMLSDLNEKWIHIQEPRTIIFDQTHAETTLILRKP